MTSRGQTSGLPGRRPGRGRGERFGRHDRRLGSSSTAAKRRSQTQGEVAFGQQHGWAHTPRAVASIGQGDVLAGGWGSPHDVDSPGGRIGGRHVAVDPGEQLGPETRARAYRHAAGAERNAEMKDLRSSAQGWAGTAASSMTRCLIEGGSPGGSGSSALPRSGARFACCAVGRLCPEHRKANLRGNVAGSTRLGGCPRGAARGSKRGRCAAQRGARRCPSHPSWVWAEPGFAERCHRASPRSREATRLGFAERSHQGDVVAGVRLDRSSQHPMTGRGARERGFPTHVEGTPLELFSSTVLFSS